jgi:hypothetical protein
MSGRTFDFKKQLSIGKEGERQFLAAYHSPLVSTDGRKNDFLRVTDSKKVELKTDSYRMDATPNFFMERWSSVEDKKPGGPFQSLKNKTDVYCYLYVNDRCYFEFSEIPRLVQELEILTRKMRPTPVRNRGWTTVGYKIPRTDLASLSKEYRYEIELASEQG